MKKSFTQDFAALERALRAQRRRRVVVVTPEQIIVEQCMTPRAAAGIERKFGIKFGWFSPTYSALKRHKLMPSQRMQWEAWLELYEQAKASNRKGS